MDTVKQVYSPQHADQISRRNCVNEENSNRQACVTHNSNINHGYSFHHIMLQHAIGANCRHYGQSLGEQVEMANYVMQHGNINALGAKVQVYSNWNLKLLDSLATSRSDREVVMYLRYGWPLNRDNAPVEKTMWNHRTATLHEHQVTKYIRKELKEKT